MATHVDHAKLIRHLARPGGPVEKDLLRKAIKVQGAARRLCPVDTGRLRASITYRIDHRAGLPVAVIGTNVAYARFVSEGTGIHGPKGAPIVAAPGRVFVFTPRGGDTVFTTQTQGVRPRPFLKQALKEALR